MKILVDADSCPVRARRVIMKAALRLDIPAIFAANRLIPELFGNAVMELCPEESQAADNRIVELAEAGDIAVSRDIALAKRLLDKGAAALDDRGRVFTKENISEFLSIRNFQVALAGSGAAVIRSPSYGKRDLKAFADSFNRLLTGKR